MKIMMHYHSYYGAFNEEQFAADEYFQQWVLATDNTTDEFWQSYLNLYPAQHESIRKASLLVHELADNDYNLQPLTALEKNELKKNIFDRLQIDEQTPVISPKKRYYTWLAAAVIASVLIASAFLLFVKPVKDKMEPMLVQVHNISETKTILLPDSSVVILNAGSSLKYKNDFLNQADREVFLEGNAFFEVKKETDHKKFVVHTKLLDVTVLGTRFNVDARTSAAEVGLTSGKVKITQPGDAGEAFMLPGEKIRIDTTDHSLVKTKFDTALYAAWMENNWRFQQTTLEDVTKLIAEYYGIVPEFKTEKYRKLRITAVIPVTNLDLLTQVISKTLHIQILQVNDRLIIS
jgi:ferric-dicitrate binding protein FerR (iron transport regulator)